MPLLSPGKFNIMMDGQFGSTGKGLLAAYIGTHQKIDLAITNAAPNAGHSFDLNDGKGIRIAYHLPVSGIINPRAAIYLCAGAIIDPALLEKELDEFGCRNRVFIHPRAAIVSDLHRAMENDVENGTTHLGSTRKGVGQALAAKIMRGQDVKLARDIFPEKMVRPLPVSDVLAQNKTVLMEVPQGYGLSINHGHSYPHCTSRDLTVAAALNDAHVHPRDLGRVIVSVRTFPIRVGHIVDDNNRQVGDSGPFWPDGAETSFKELGLPPEYTTVTKRERRIAHFSFLQYEDMLKSMRPDTVFVNFMNYLKTPLSRAEFLNALHEVERKARISPEKLYGIGPSVSDVFSDVKEALDALSLSGQTSS